MTIREKIGKLAKETSKPCVTISLNTHRTHPDSDKDAILLKNLLKEAGKRVTDKYGKKSTACLLERLSKVGEEIDVRCNLDSLHIFLSDDNQEIIRIAWPTPEDRVYIGDTFDVRTLIKAYNRTEEYLILVLSQGGVELYEVINDGVVEEIRNDDFPFTDNPFYLANGAERSNAKLVDDLAREFFNRVDKALVKVSQETNLCCVVICVEENYSYLMEVADRPDIYLGHIPIDYNRTKPHQIAKQGWDLVRREQHERRTEAIEEVKEAVSKSLVLTDLQEIYQAAIDGRGDLLIVYEDFSQPVRMKDERSFELASDSKGVEIIDDITGVIAWEVLSKKGKVFFTKQEEIKELGDIVLKTRY